MLTERSIINFLIWIAGLIIGPYLAYSLLWGDRMPLLVTAAAVFIFFMFAVAKDMLCIAPLVGLYMAGKINFIPGKPDGFEFGTAAAILFYLVTYTALRRKRVLTGPLYFFIPIVILTAIVVYHDPTASLHMAGGQREGGRAVLTILLAAASYLCGVSMNSPSPQFFSRTPIYCIVIVILSNIPYVVTTYLPSTSAFFYTFTDNINIAAYVVDLGGTEDVVRNGAQASVGSMIAIFLLCYFPIHTWWRPDRWWVALVALACAWFVVVGGYRGGFVGFTVMAFTVIWCYSSWRALVLVPPLVAVIGTALALQNSHLVHLPEAAQRTLSFLPGDWDSEPLESAQASNDFRQKIREVYLKEEAGKHPWVGNGITFDTGEFERYTFLAQTHETEDGYYNTKEFITGKMFHTGWISVYDAVGLVGSAALAAFALAFLWVSGRSVFGKQADRGSFLFPFKIWIFSNLFGNVFSFLTVFGDIKGIFPVLCVYAIIWVHLERLEKFGYRPPVRDQLIPFDPERTKLPVPV